MEKLEGFPVSGVFSPLGNQGRLASNPLISRFFLRELGVRPVSMLAKSETSQ